jgi:hypothetical protein
MLRPSEPTFDYPCWLNSSKDLFLFWSIQQQSDTYLVSTGFCIYLYTLCHALLELFYW